MFKIILNHIKYKAYSYTNSLSKFQNKSFKFIKKYNIKKSLHYIIPLHQTRTYFSFNKIPEIMTYTFGNLSVKQMSLVGTLVLDVGINWIGWILAVIFKTEKFYDFFGTISFTAVSLASLLNAQIYTSRQITVTSMVILWTWRLGSLLLARVIMTGGDSRFKEAVENPGLYFIYWTMQSVWVWVSCLPVIFLNANHANKSFGVTDGIGIALYIVGLLCESIADYQKFIFKLNPDNKGKFINTGIWQFSRYPNYFGEMLIWWGIFLTSSRGLSGADFVSIASPVFVMLLLCGLSGIPIQEKQARERWGEDLAYIEYRKNTNLLVPIPKFWAKKE